MMASEINRVIRAAEEQGWTVNYTRSNHIKFTAPNGKRYATSSTPGDRRALQNTVADLRRLGLVYDRQRDVGRKRRKRAAAVRAARGGRSAA